MRPIFLRLDDAGLSVGTNRAVASVAALGRNIGLMAVGPAIEDAVARFRDRDDVCLGLHFTINSEWTHPRWGALCERDEVPTLLRDDGTFHENPFRLPRPDLYDTAHVERELAAQLARLRGLGATIRYLDAHMGVFQSRPDLMELAHRFAKAEGLEFADALPRWNPGANFGTVADDLARWKSRLPTLSGPCVVIFHPAESDGIIDRLVGPSGESILDGRDADRALMASPEFAEFLRSNDLDPRPFAPA